MSSKDRAERYPQPEPLELELLDDLRKSAREVSFAKADEGQLTTHLDRLNTLFDVSANALGALNVEDLLQRLVDGARRVTGARLATAGYGYHAGTFLAKATSGPKDTVDGKDDASSVEPPEIALELIERCYSIRSNVDELPIDHTSSGGFLGARLVGQEGAADGYVLVFDKSSGEFTAEDEALLSQLAVFTSLGLQHIQTLTELLDTRERLVRQEKLAFLGALAGGVGHELRTPLGSIKNAAYFLKMVLSNPSDDVGEALAILEREVGTTEGIIAALLDFARPREPEQRPTELVDLLRKTLSKLRVPDSVEVTWRLEPVASVSVDPIQIGQVFRNILENALQAMPDGGRLTIETGSTSSEEVHVAITDTGPGISAEHLSELFEPLFTTRARGIGLGLSVAQTLVERHGGFIDVDSAVGRGSTFRVRLPVGGTEGR